MPREQRNTLQASAYHSYLVRFWQSNAQGDWRASAQRVQTGNTVLFGNVESMLAFLQTEIMGGPSPDGECITPLKSD